MFELIRSIADRFLSLPSYGIAATSLFVLYAVQAEIRFGAKARATRSGPSDRFSTIVLSLAMLVPLLGFILAMKGRFPITLPGMPATAWVGVILGTSGFALRLWCFCFSSASRAHCSYTQGIRSNATVPIDYSPSWLLGIAAAPERYRLGLR
jgi:hypothetical protein